MRRPFFAASASGVGGVPGNDMVVHVHPNSCVRLPYSCFRHPMTTGRRGVTPYLLSRLCVVCIAKTHSLRTLPEGGSAVQGAPELLLGGGCLCLNLPVDCACELRHIA